MRDRFDNEQLMIIVIVTVICLTIAACVLGGIYISRVL